MKEIQILGTKSKKYFHLKNTLLSFIDKNDIEVKLSEHAALHEFLNLELKSIPAIYYNDLTYCFGEENDFEEQMEELMTKLKHDFLEKSHNCKNCGNCKCKFKALA